MKRRPPDKDKLSLIPHKDRLPSAEELHVWEYVTRMDEKLPHAEIAWQLVGGGKPPVNDEREWIEEAFPAPSKAPLPKPTTSSRHVSPDVLDRVKKGQQAIDAKLDLHGMKAGDAKASLVAFLEKAVRKQMRMVLVVTGKGQAEAGVRKTGILRHELPKWLALTPCREQVLAFGYAAPQHGGEGAFYLLLRRSR